MVGQLSGEPVRRDPELVGLLRHVRAELGRLDPEIGLGGQLVENEAGLHGAAGILGELLPEFVRCLAGRLQVGLQRGIGAFQPVLERAAAVLDLELDQLIGERDVDPGQHRVQGPLPCLADLAGPPHPLELPAGGRPELAQGVELARRLGELVVELGQFLDLDALHGHGHLGGAAGQLAAGQFRAEVAGLARGHPGQRLVKAVQHGPGADLVRYAAGLRILDRLAVDGGRQVDRDEVAVGDRAVDALE